jgi:hypothetical protein
VRRFAKPVLDGCACASSPAREAAMDLRHIETARLTIVKPD